VSIAIELPNDCEGDILFLFRTKPRTTPAHIPGWVFHGDVEFAPEAIGDVAFDDVTVTRAAYWRRVERMKFSIEAGQTVTIHAGEDASRALWLELMNGVDSSGCSSPHMHACLYSDQLEAEVFRLRERLSKI